MDAASLLRQHGASLFEAHELAFQAQTARLNALLGIEKSQELALDLTRNEIALARYAQSSALTLMELSRPQDEDEGDAGHSFSSLQVKQCLSPSSSGPAPVAEDLAATIAKQACEDRARQKREPNQNARAFPRPTISG